MKILVSVWALSLTMGSFAYGQAVPSVNTTISSTGSNPNVPAMDGTLHYSMSASEQVQFGYFASDETTSSTVLSGNVSFTGKSQELPFSMLVSGGVFLSNGNGQGTSTFWNAAVTQGIIGRRWALTVSDSFSFLPQSPTTGLSGIPGVGDLGSQPVQGPVTGPGGGILTYSGDRYVNSLSGSIERQIAPATSISGSGSWSVIHFLDEFAGLDNNEASGVVALNHRLDGRSSVSLNADYTTFSYSGSNTGPGTPDFQTKGINLSYQRLLNRGLSMAVSGGPLWISSSDSAVIPTRLSAAASASLNYTRNVTNASLNYSRGANAGSGVIPGALSDTILGSVGRTFGRKWVTSADGGYAHSTGLAEYTVEGFLIGINEVYNTVFAGVQLTRGLSVHYSTYASFTVQHQTSNYSFAGLNGFNGTSEVFGIGITFTPRSTRLGQF
ncbi:MAG: hypothetical protein WDN23_03825 [Edaphobacter sp.]